MKEVCEMEIWKWIIVIILILVGVLVFGAVIYDDTKHGGYGPGM